LLECLESLSTGEIFTYQVVVVDNAGDQSGRPVVEEAASRLRLKIEYYHETQRSISLARNRCIREAKGDYIAFIDDDEFPAEDWLLKLYCSITQLEADGILGPVKPHFDKNSPEWLVRSRLLDRKHFKTGETIRNSKDTRTGNVLFRRSLFEDTGALFDPKYGLSGGGDVNLFHRMMQRGKVFKWCNEAVVYEHVPAERQTKRYYVQRAFTRGMAASWKVPFLSFSTLKSILAIAIYSVSMPFCLVIGQHLFMRVLVKTCDHIGKILSYMGINPVKERPY
jgi:glycosyltransferase involved in cell wall biosynthesis